MADILDLVAAATSENERCVAVVKEMRAFFVQEGAPDVAIKLLDECASRIELRRLLGKTEEATRAGAARDDEQEPRTAAGSLD